MKKTLIVPALLLLLGAGCWPSGQPVAEAPTNAQPSPQPAPQPQPAPAKEDPTYGPSYKANLIVVDTLRVGDTIESPLTVTGKARGNWFFEASFPVQLVDANGKLMANGIAQAQDEWMTTDFVPYKVTLTFGKAETETGALVFTKDNPSGLPQHDDRMILPVRFASQK